MTNDIFRLMERRGSGLKKIIDETAKLPGYTDSLKPEFRSTPSEFHVVLKNVNYNYSESKSNLTNDAAQESIFDKILEFCVIPKSRKEICEHLGYKNLTYFSRHFLKPLIEQGKLKLTIPDKPNSKMQKYVSE